MSHKQRYIDYCQTHTVPLFLRPEWLDAAEAPWHVLYQEQNQFSAYWVYHLETKWGLRFIRNPHLTPYTGFVFSDPLIDEPNRHALIEALWKQGPVFDVLDMDLTIHVQQLPSLLGIQVLRKRSNILTLTSAEELYEQCKPALKRQIRKADKYLIIEEKDDISLFYALHIKTFEKQKKRPNISLVHYKRYWQLCKKINCGKLFFIRDVAGNYHASLWMVYDEDTAYYLAGGTDHQFYGSGAMSKLMWHAIQTAIVLQKTTFDFEGSMLPAVNKFFQNFSPKEVSYFHLHQINHFLYRWYQKMKG